MTVPSVFVKLSLSLQFLDNVNTMLVPIVLASIVYTVYKVRLSYNKFHFLETKEKVFKDKYTILRRTAEWFFEHYVFTFSVALMFITIFSTVLQMVSNTSTI